jgi:hypothetical protein
MTERSFGSNFKWFVAKVVNRGDGKTGDKDKTESGRVQIRIYGKHDDEKNIPDANLPWAIPMLPINSGAGRAGVSASPLGLQKDSQVVGFYADGDENICILIGILTRAGEDPDKNSKEDGGEEVKASGNDLPKGARTAATEGGDKNDALKDKSIVNDVGQNAQTFLDKKTIGNIPFDPGTSALNYINKADPSNLSGAIPGALNGMKSMTSTLNVASSLLSNFSGLMSGKLNLSSLLSLGAKASGIKNYVPNVSAITSIASTAAGVASSASSLSAAATVAKSVGGNVSVAGGVINQVASGIAAANIAKNLVAGAFNGGNPLESILGGLGGLQGLTSLAGKATGLLGPISGNFAAASAISSTMRSGAQSVFTGAGLAPKPQPLLGSSPLSGLAGGAIPQISNLLTSSGLLNAVKIQNSPLNNAALNSFVQGVQIASLLNSSVTLPTSVSLVNIANIIKNNTGIAVGVSSTIPKIITKPIVQNYVSAKVTPNVTVISSTYNVSSLNNSSVNVNIPISSISAINYTLNKVPGISYKATGSVFQITHKTKRV